MARSVPSKEKKGFLKKKKKEKKKGTVWNEQMNFFTLLFLKLIASTGRKMKPRQKHLMEGGVDFATTFHFSRFAASQIKFDESETRPCVCVDFSQ